MPNCNSEQSGTEPSASQLAGSIPPQDFTHARTVEFLEIVKDATEGSVSCAMRRMCDSDKEQLLEQAIAFGSNEDLQKVLCGIKLAPFGSGRLPLGESLLLRAAESDPATFEAALAAGYSIMAAEDSGAQTAIVMSLLLSEEAHTKIAAALVHDADMPLVAKLAANSLMESMDTSAALLRVGPGEIDPEVERITDITDTTTMAVSGLMSLIKAGAEVDVPRVARTFFEPFRSGSRRYHPDLLAVRADLLEQVKNEVSSLPEENRGYVAAVMLKESLEANAAAMQNDTLDEYAYEACVDFRAHLAAYADLHAPIGKNGLSLSQLAEGYGVREKQTLPLAMPTPSLCGDVEGFGHDHSAYGRN